MTNTVNKEGVNMTKVTQDKLVNILNQFGMALRITKGIIEFSRENRTGVMTLTFLQDIYKKSDMVLNVNIHSIRPVAIRHENEAIVYDGKYITHPITDTGLLNIAKEIIETFDNCK